LNRRKRREQRAERGTRGRGGGFEREKTEATKSATAFAVLATTNLASPSPDWEVLGQPTLLSNCVYQFTDPAGTNSPQRFYQLRSP